MTACEKQRQQKGFFTGLSCVHDARVNVQLRARVFLSSMQPARDTASIDTSIRMKDTKSNGREGFAWLQVWKFKECDWRYEVQNPVSVFCDISFILVCNNTGGVCARAGTGLLPTSMHVPRLTCEHEIPEKRELVDDNDRHIETKRNIQNSA